MPIAVPPRLISADQLGGLRSRSASSVDHDRVGAELLAQGHRHRVLELGSAHLEHALNSSALRPNASATSSSVACSVAMCTCKRNLHRRRIDVVGALAEVDVFERMQPCRSSAGRAEDLERSVGDHLVGVHVGRRARAALDDVDDELVVQFTVADFRAGRHDRGGTLVIEQTEFAIGHRRSLFHRGQGVDELWIRRSAMPEMAKFAKAREVWMP